ncbi:peroxiredoxin [Jatrophihabitans sp.]|uniref:peroxiredoxin n=1 Tax=Jatrophihabitans sp. TaxID=1932789 RepID=UPI0038CD79D6
MADAVSVPGLTPLPVGTEAPDFTLRDQNNEVVTLSSFRGSKAVLLVFYPWAFTSICTGELGQIRDRIAEFANDAVQVLTLSIDSSFVHKIFSQRDELNFPLLADFWPHGAVAEAYGVFNTDAGVSNRGTFLIDRDGIIRFSEAKEIGVGRDPQRWLDEIAAVTSGVAG